MSSKSPLGDPVTLPMKLRRFQIEIFLGYFDIPASFCICTALSRKEVEINGTLKSVRLKTVLSLIFDLMWSMLIKSPQVTEYGC